jgi:hypothetical protein
MRLLVVEDSALLRKMFGLAFPHQFNDLRQAENGCGFAWRCSRSSNLRPGDACDAPFS